MGKTNLFLLLPESETSSTSWTKSNEHLLEYEHLLSFIKELDTCFDRINVENYDAFYDELNLSFFLQSPSIIDDYFPNSLTRILQLTFKKFALRNWREYIVWDSHQLFHIFGQTIENHTFCAMTVYARLNTANDNFALLNHSALTINDTITVTSETDITEIPNLRTSDELFKWFCENRIPSRNFNVIPKHGENGQYHWPEASPLLCSGLRAQTLLKSAVGNDQKNLFNFDTEHQQFITFWFENTLTDDGKLSYHGYHVQNTEAEIPSEFRLRLLP